MEINKLSQRYLGARATNYDDERVSETKWAAEQDGLARLVAEIPPGSVVLDVPVGTGRLPDLLRQKDIYFVGVDVSKDMIEQTRKKLGLDDRDRFTYKTGSIFNLPLEDKFSDYSFCVRFLNWVDIAQVGKALDELGRVTKQQVVVGVRTHLPASKLRSVKDIGRFLRMAAGYSRRRARKSGLVYHSEADLLRLFSERGLKILEVRMLEERGDGTNYAFYKLAVAG